MSLLPDCEGCQRRREAIAKWLADCRAWAANPIGRPIPAPPVDGMTKIEPTEK